MKHVRISGSANNEIYVVFAVMKKCGRMKSDLVCRIKKANKILGRAKWELVPGPTALTLVFNLIDVSWGRPPFNDHPNHSYRDALRNTASSTYPRCNSRKTNPFFFFISLVEFLNISRMNKYLIPPPRCFFPTMIEIILERLLLQNFPRIIGNNNNNNNNLHDARIWGIRGMVEEGLVRIISLVKNVPPEVVYL